MKIGARFSLRLACLATALCFVFGGPGRGMTAPVAAAELWNPRPFDDDVVIGLPCDQKMAFRRIVTQEAVDNQDGSILVDRRIRLGSADIENAYLDYLRSDFIAGSFARDNQRFFLLAKYEVTQAQFSAVMTQECDFPTEAGEMPVNRISWFDAMEFNRRLTAYMLANEKETLAEEVRTQAAFARLPTESEWEFAARGGVAVSVAEFQAARFPMNGDLNDYAWYNDPLSAQGDITRIGLLQPNPLGLFDIYGNVAEMMFDSFRLNKAGRSHGLAGGVIVKGGSFQSNGRYVTSAEREEEAYFDAERGEEKTSRANGIRVVIAGLALPTGADVSRLIDEWKDASRSRLPEIDDPIELIGRLRETVADLELSGDLATIDQAIRAEISRKEEDQSRLLNGMLFSLGRTVSVMRERKYSYDKRLRLKEQTASSGILSGGALDDEIAEDWEDINQQSYFAQELLVRVIDVFEPQEIDQEARALAAELRLQHLADIAEAALVSAKVATRIATGGQQFTREQIRDLLTEDL